MVVYNLTPKGNTQKNKYAFHPQSIERVVVEAGYTSIYFFEHQLPLIIEESIDEFWKEINKE